MKFFSIAAIVALSAATVSSTKVACRVNGVQESVVDLETGFCEFKIPSALPVTFIFNTEDNYDVDAYYAKVNGARVFNDIAKAGRTISIPAKALYEEGEFPLYHIHSEQKPSSNSTQALHARFNKKLTKRVDIFEMVAKIESMSGGKVPCAFLKVNKPEHPTASKSSSDSAAPTLSTDTVTNIKTTVITITSCSDNKCSETMVSATEGPTTITSDGTTIVYTTWCPVTAAETSTTTKAVATTTITVTHCSDNKCSETMVTATEGPTTVTSAGTTMVYTTWCPVTAAETSTTTTAVATTTITVTHCSDNKCSETMVPATEGPTTVTSHGTTMVYTTWCPVTAAETKSVATLSTQVKTEVTSVSPGTTNTTPIMVASQSTTQSQMVSVKLSNAGYKVGASLFTLALSLAYIL